MIGADLKASYYNTMDNALGNKEKTDTLLTALSAIDDIDWLENFYIQYSQSENIDIARLSLICLGHLARIHEFIHTDKVIPFLTKMKKSNKELAGTIEDVLSDIAIFTNQKQVTDFYGMWADRDIDVDKFVRELRKSRIEHLLGENETLDFSHLNSQ